MKLLICIFSCIPLCVFAQSWFTTDQKAELMLSGVDFNQCGGALRFNHPNGLASDGKNLLMCDRFNNRVLVWYKAPDAWNIEPDLVIGQLDMLSNNPGNGKQQMNWPGNVSVSKSGKLAIADTNNDRLLLWNQFPTSNGQAADISIHLPTLSPPGIPQRWAWPWGVWTDGTRLAAVATSGATLLFWNQFPTRDNQAPDYTISLSTFGTPRNISTDGVNYFFVGDHNAKVTGRPGTFFWNSYPSQSNQTYDFYRDEWIKGTVLSSGAMIASGLQHIYTWDSIPTNDRSQPSKTAIPSYYDNGDGVDVVEANGYIYVCNYNGNNVLAYKQPPDQVHPDPEFAIGIEDYHLNTLDSIAYIQNPCLASDGEKLIVSSDYDRRIYLFNKIPDRSGAFADEIISTQAYDLAPWDNALFNGIFAAVGKQRVCIWNQVDKIKSKPDLQFSGNIGTAAFTDLHGVALDAVFFYLADANGKVWVWKGIPSNASENPFMQLDFGTAKLNRLSSDGTYLTVAQTSPPAVYVFRVEDMLNGKTTAWKTVGGIGFLNLPSEAITFQGSLAIANQGFHDVLLWKNIEDAPNVAKMTVLGQSANMQGNTPAIGINRLFMPGALLHLHGNLWVGEHKFSSRILQFKPMSITGTSDVQTVSMNIFPNPSNGIFQLSWNGSLQKPTALKLFSVTGQLLHQYTLPGALQFELDLQHLPNGSYALQVFFENGLRESYLVGINH